MAESINSLINCEINGRGAKIKRAAAVAAALEVIVAKVSHSPGHHGQVEQEMENLAKYADLIEAAIGK